MPDSKSQRAANDVDSSSVLVVLPTLNEAPHIEACIASLMVPAGWMAATKIVVVDGGSTDGTQDTVTKLIEKYPNLELCVNQDRIQSAGINRAVEKCSGPKHQFMVRCDVHAIYPEGYVQDTANKLNDSDLASVVTCMDAVGHAGFQRAAAWVVDTKLGAGGSAHRGGAASGLVDHGHHAAFDLSWFRAVGGYDPTFSHNEDAEYDFRLGKRDGKIWLASDIRVQYLMRPSVSALARQYWNYGRGRARTVLKHKMRPRVRQLIPVLNILLLVASVIGVFMSPIFLFWPTLYLALLIGTSIAGVVALKSLDGVWAGVALGAMHIAWGAGFLRQVIGALPRIGPVKPVSAKN